MKNLNINPLLKNPLILRLLIIIFILRIISLWIINWKIITKPFDAHETEIKYYQSQWFDPRSETPIDDEELYEYVGYAFIKKGLGVFEANPEMPPLGKYIIGWIEINSGWSKLTGPIFSTLAIILLTILGINVFKNPSLAFLISFVYTFQPIYYENFWRSHLDTMILCCLILAMILLYKKKLVWGVLMLGFLPALKFSVFYLILVLGFIFIYIFIKRDFRILFFTPLLIVPLILSYLPFFISGNTIIDWLKNEKWIVDFYLSSSANSPLYNPVVMLLSGYWKQWWGDFSWQRFEEWNIIWPLSLILPVINFRKIWQHEIVKMLIIWLFVYMGSLLFTLPMPKYFMLVLPFLYITAAYSGEQLIYKG